MGIYIFIGLVSLVFIFSSIVGNRIHKEKLNKLSESRPKLSKEEYLKYFVNKGYRKQYIEDVYDKIEIYISYEWFSMHPEDDLIDDYEIDHEDLEDLLTAILKKNKLTLPEKSVLDGLNEKYANGHTSEHLIEVISLGHAS